MFYYVRTHLIPKVLDITPHAYLLMYLGIHCIPYSMTLIAQ